MLRILFTGGDTGGHIYPILAIVEELQIIMARGSASSSQEKIDLDLRYFGAPGNYQYLLSTNGILVSKIFSAKIRRYFNIRNFFDFPIFFLSVIQAFWKVFWFMPDVLFSKGGPGSLPVVLACKFYQIPIIIHESDAIVSLTAKISSRYAARIGISFESSAKLFSEKLIGKIALVGNPVRRSLTSGNMLDQKTAKKLFGFNPEKPLILVLGGSQGSARINDFMLNVAPELVKKFQIIHQTGNKNFEEIKNELTIVLKNFSNEEKSAYKIVPYFEKDLKDAYSAADLAVSRAGSGIIFELAAFGKPAILIPLADAANNHQVVNAYEYAKNGGAIVIEEDNLKPGIFLTQLEKLFSDFQNLKSMSEAAKKFAKPEAAKIIAGEILKLGI